MFPETVKASKSLSSLTDHANNAIPQCPENRSDNVLSSRQTIPLGQSIRATAVKQRERGGRPCSSRVGSRSSSPGCQQHEDSRRLGQDAVKGGKNPKGVICQFKPVGNVSGNGCWFVQPQPRIRCGRLGFRYRGMVIVAGNFITEDGSQPR